MRFPHLALTVAASTVGILAACGGSTPPANGPTTTPSASVSAEPSTTASAPASAAPSEVAAPNGPWSKTWSMQEQVAFMKAKVMPVMTPIFKGADAKKYAEFSCYTCHGNPPGEPTKALPHLKMKGGKLTCFTEKPEVSKFMAEKVVKPMAEAMGLTPFDPATKKGDFGCMNCHVIDEVK